MGLVFLFCFVTVIRFTQKNTEVLTYIQKTQAKQRKWENETCYKVSEYLWTPLSLNSLCSSTSTSQTITNKMKKKSLCILFGVFHWCCETAKRRIIGLSDRVGVNMNCSIRKWQREVKNWNCLLCPETFHRKRDFYSNPPVKLCL